MKRRLLVMIALCMALVCTCMFCTAGAEDTGSPEAAETVQSTETGEEPADAESTGPAGNSEAGILAEESFRTETLGEGFSVPVPADQNRFEYSGRPSDFSYMTTDEEAPYYLYFDYKIYNPLAEFTEDPEAAARMYDLVLYNMEINGPEEVEQETVMVDGHPAHLIVLRAPSSQVDFPVGGVFYTRNNRIIRIRFAVTAQNETTWEDLPRITLGDMRLMAEQLIYDPAGASITTADGEIALSAKGDAATLSGGKKLQLSAAFANTDRVNKKAKNDTVEWSVVDAETKAPAEHVKVDKKGGVTADKNVDRVMNVEVVATSPIFHTSASYPLTVIPALKGLAAEPKTLTFYAGETREENVKAALNPDTVPPLGLTWTAKPEGIAEITAGEDGTATIKPLKAGKTVVTVKEPGGKSAKVNVSVLVPVESVELTVKGKAKAGGTVTVTAAMSPKKAGNKAVEWSLNVGEDIATISAKGQIKISKTAAEGTVITATCRALGAAEPVTATVDIPVGQ